MDPVGLKAAQRRRDAEADAAVSGAEPKADEKRTAPAVDFTRPGAPPSSAVKARRESRLAELLKAREAEKAKFADAWNEGE